VITIGYDGVDPRAAVAFVEGECVRLESSASTCRSACRRLVSGYVLVPWATQRLSVLSARDGRELARWDFQHAVLGYAQVDRGRVFIGQHGLMPLDQHALEHAPRPSLRTHRRSGLCRGSRRCCATAMRRCPSGQRGEPAQSLDWRIGGGNGPLHSENDLVALRFSPFLV